MSMIARNRFSLTVLLTTTASQLRLSIYLITMRSMATMKELLHIVSIPQPSC
jgi:hypothetical protein